MSYVTEAMLEAAARRWGEPRRLRVAYEISPRERDLIRHSRRDDRSHDVTFFIRRGGEYAVIAKPSFPAGVWRAPSGGLKPGETVEEGTRREAYEETGLDIDLERYLLRIEARFTSGDAVEPWHTHVFLARTNGGEIDPHDLREIRAARWATRDEMLGPIRAALLATGFGLFRYRSDLTDATFEALGGA